MIKKNLPTIIFLMGPTASGKTPFAVELTQKFPCDIISVDSAMVYRDMNIGTAKPDLMTQQIAPHRLIDIKDPNEIYSAGQFRVDALREINHSIAQHRIPLLVGGTMLYFNILLSGIAPLPVANQAMRDQLQERIHSKGLAALHHELKQIDPVAAERIHVNDTQRLQRALEVYYATGKPISVWQKNSTHALQEFNVHQFAIIPDRDALHQRINTRLHTMIKHGFIDEVKMLMHRPGITKDLPSMRSVGYAQMWRYLSNEISYDEMVEQTLIATRQLAKRQMTWLRAWKNLEIINSDVQSFINKIKHYLS